MALAAAYPNKNGKRKLLFVRALTFSLRGESICFARSCSSEGCRLPELIIQQLVWYYRYDCWQFFR
jgi:hypothetical protein